MTLPPDAEIRDQRAPEPVPASQTRRGPARWALRLIEALHRWAESGWARSALFAWATINGSVFPGPSDSLLVPLGLANPKCAFEYAGWTILGSMVGGCIAFAIGAFAFQSIGLPVLSFIGVSEAQLQQVETLFAQRGWIVVVIGTLPFGSPKIVSIAAGAFGVPFPYFFFALLAMRTVRFLVVATLLYFAGSRLTLYIERRLGRPLFAPRS